MAERSTWPETHLNAVNKLLCWDCSFLGKATRPAATSHIPTSRAVHLGVRWERQVGWEAKEKKSSSFGYCGRRRKGSVSLREPLGNPQVGAITKLWSTPSLAYHQSTRELKKKNVWHRCRCASDGRSKAREGEQISLQRECTKTKRSAIRQRSAPVSTAVS